MRSICLVLTCLIFYNKNIKNATKHYKNDCFIMFLMLFLQFFIFNFSRSSRAEFVYAVLGDRPRHRLLTIYRKQNTTKNFKKHTKSWFLVGVFCSFSLFLYVLRKQEIVSKSVGYGPWTPRFSGTWTFAQY